MRVLSPKMSIRVSGVEWQFDKAIKLQRAKSEAAASLKSAQDEVVRIYLFVPGVAEFVHVSVGGRTLPACRGRRMSGGLRGAAPRAGSSGSEIQRLTRDLGCPENGGIHEQPQHYDGQHMPFVQLPTAMMVNGSRFGWQRDEM